MTRLAAPIRLYTGKETAVLRPTLRAAFALAKEFGSFSPILKGIAEGNLSTLARVLAECGCSDALGDLFFVSGRSLASRVVEIQTVAFELLNGLIAADPDAKDEPRPAAASTKADEPIEFYDSLFGFATAILHWTPEATWNATPGEILAARIYFVDAQMTPEERKKRDQQEAWRKLPPAEQARMTFAALRTRRKPNAC